MLVDERLGSPTSTLPAVPSDRPEAPPPPPLDLRRVLWIATAGWALALLVLGALALTGAVGPRPVAICAAGVMLGFLALSWERRDSRR